MGTINTEEMSAHKIFKNLDPLQQQIIKELLSAERKVIHQVRRNDIFVNITSIIQKNIK